MKAYLITTGVIFGLMAVLHVWRAIDERGLLKSDPVQFYCMAALGIVAGALSAWAWRLARRV